MNNTMSLDEFAGTSVANSFDMTSGSVKPADQVVADRKVVPVMVGGSNLNADTVRAVDINALLPKKEQTVDPQTSELFSALDNAVAREKDNITARQEAIFNKMREEVEAEQSVEEEKDLDRRINDEDDAHLDSIDVGDFDRVSIDDEVDDPIVVRTTSDNFLPYMENSDLFDDEEDAEVVSPVEDETPSDEELLASIKEQVKHRLSPESAPIKRIDLSKFTVAKKAFSAQKIMKLAVTGHQNIADWVLPAANRSISMTGLSGPEIVKLDASNSNRNRMNTFKDMYGILYKHLVDANKPEFEVWLKQVRFTDLQHIYFAAYMATFNGSSFTNYSCPNCKNVFIHDIEFKDMVKYKNDEAKARIQNLLKRDSTTDNADTYEIELVQISDKYVFGLRTPSIWNTVIEIASLSDKFLENHADLIDLIAYIDSIYLINYDTSELVPVDTKPDPNDMGKTVARRVKSMHDIISTLNSEEYYALRSAIGEIDNNADEVTFKLPGCTCPKCNKEIPENNNITPEQLLFTRHQLAAIANTSN